MDIKFEEQYFFKVSEADIEQIHTDIGNLLGALPKSIYDDVLICAHELIINSIEEIKVTNQKKELVTIDLVLTEEEAILCLKDFGRGICKSQLENRDQDPLKERGRGLDIIMMLSDWFCICSEDDCCSFYVIKKYTL